MGSVHALSTATSDLGITAFHNCFMRQLLSRHKPLGCVPLFSYRLQTSAFVLLLCCLQAQQQLSRLQAAADTHSSNIAARDAFVRSTAQKMGVTLPGEPQPAAAAAGARPQPLPPAALDFFRGELAHREGQLQSELSSLREAHR